MGEKALHFSPLYELVKRAILERIISGEWPPGEFLPSEQTLANEYGVSQGTLRKALNTLTDEKLLIRYQGKGTAVSMLSEKDKRSPFMHFYDRSCRRVSSFQCRNFTLDTGISTEEEMRALRLEQEEPVTRLDRVRLFDGKPVVNERVVVVASLFPRMDSLPCDIFPSRLYAFYQSRFGVTVARSSETIDTVRATREDSERLSVEEGEPLLRVSRISLDLRGKSVEYRLSHINTRDYVYVNESY